jgi:ABC-2 type transport system ATP-binding protein
MSKTILEARNLVKKYGDLMAVKDVNLAIQEGEIFGLLGPNGAGKTTIISMITGLLKPTSGQITVDGLDLQTDTNTVKAKLGLVPQELALYPTLSARDNLAFFGSIYGLGGKHLRERVDAMLGMVELTERANEAIETYSGGMKRRVNIAAGLLHEPEVLFLDDGHLYHALYGRGAAAVPPGSHHRRGSDYRPRHALRAHQQSGWRHPGTRFRRPRSWPRSWASADGGRSSN